MQLIPWPFTTDKTNKELWRNWLVERPICIAQTMRYVPVFTLQRSRALRFVLWSTAVLTILAVSIAAALYVRMTQGDSLPPDRSRALLGTFVGGQQNLPQPLEILNGWEAKREGLGYAVRFRLPPDQIESVKQSAIKWASAKHDFQRADENDEMPRGRTFGVDRLPKWWNPGEVSNADALALRFNQGLRWIAISRDTGLGYYYYATY